MSLFDQITMSQAWRYTMTPHNEQFDALMAIAELVEIDALDPDDDLPYYTALALNMHPDDVLADPVLGGLMNQMRTTGSNKQTIALRMLQHAMM